jgi:hypothetical protein
MATKFSQLYKQELKSQGILSSLGSAALKQTRQRMDIRNTLFGGSGVLSLAGQKIFGKGYSPLEKASSVLSSSPTSTSSGADSQGITDLLASSERQEALLRVISKNTFNMNLMARDTNITRQNIVTLTKKMTGRSSKSQDALWYDVKTRNTAIDALAKKRNENTQPGNTAPSNMGGSSFMGSIMGGLGTIGSLGGGILGGLFGVIGKMSPILAIIGLAGAAYVVKQLVSQVDFTGLKKSMLEAIGIDSESQEPILKQLSKKLDDALGLDSKPFASFYEWMEKSPFMNKLGEKIDTISKTAINYTMAAFRTLGDSFGKVGDIFSYYFGEFFNANKGLILGVLGASIGSLLGVKGAALGGLIGAVVGAATGNKDLPGLMAEQAEKEQTLSQLVADRTNLENNESKLNISDKAKLNDYRTGNRGKAVKQLEDSIAQLQTQIETKKDEQRRVVSFDPAAAFKKNLEEIESKKSRSSPSQVPSSEMIKLIYSKFKDAGFNDAQAKAAIANAMAESSLNPNATNITGKEESYGLFQINRKAHPEFSAAELVDPVKNIDAMIKIMKKDQKSYDTFRGLTDENAATAYFMRQFERPANQSDAKVNDRLQNLNKIPGDILNSSSRALSDANRPDSSPPVVTVVQQPQPAPTQTRSTQGSTASAFNPDILPDLLRYNILNPHRIGS